VVPEKEDQLFSCCIVKIRKRKEERREGIGKTSHNGVGNRLRNPEGGSKNRRKAKLPKKG